MQNIGTSLARGVTCGFNALSQNAVLSQSFQLASRDDDETEQPHKRLHIQQPLLLRRKPRHTYIAGSLKNQKHLTACEYSLSNKTKDGDNRLSGLIKESPSSTGIKKEHLILAMLAYLKVSGVQPQAPTLTTRRNSLHLQNDSGLGKSKKHQRIVRPLRAKIPRRQYSTTASGAGRPNQSLQQSRTLKTNSCASTDTPFDASASAKLPAKTRLYTVGCGFSKEHDPRLQVKPNEYCIGCDSADRNFGEDAAFIAETESADVMGVSDGVGGWRNHGIDPSLFSGTLARNLKNMVSDPRFEVTQPVQLLSRAYNELYREPDLIGSATACVATFDRKSMKLYTANLGDSGYMVIRNGKIVARSTAQTHSFNAPFQLSKVPPNQQRGSFCDQPHHSDFSEFQCQHGDVIIMATDGMFDNVFDEHVVGLLEQLDLGTPLDLFKSEKTPSTDADRASSQEADSGIDEPSEQLKSRLEAVPTVIEAAVSNMVAYTRYRAHQKDYHSPFAMEMNQKRGTRVTGGKVDDITILVSVVGPRVT